MSVSDKLGLSWLSAVTDHGWFVALWWGWLFTPVLFFVVALVLESRVAPVWRNQFRSFIPGDLFLGGVFAASVHLAEGLPEKERWYSHHLWHFIVLAGSVTLGLLARKLLDAPFYYKGQLWSPSKVYHDFALYIGYGGLLFVVGLPALVYGGGVTARVVMVGCLAVWLGTLIFDGLRPAAELERMRKLAHPSYQYLLLWRNKKLVR